MRHVPLLLAILLTSAPLLGCERGTQMPVSTEPRVQEHGDSFSPKSRVFDGRDSLQTGVRGPIATKDNFAIVTRFLEVQRNGERTIIHDPETLATSTVLFERREGNEILAPDGHPVSWGEFRAANGAIIVQCLHDGTHVVLHLSDLIPKGVYSVQNRLFEPGSTVLLAETAFAEWNTRRSRTASPGPSAFRASNSGEGSIRGFVPAKSLPRVSSCMLDDVESDRYDWRTVVSYQLDGTPEMDAPGTYVEQGEFTFTVADSPPVVE